MSCIFCRIVAGEAPADVIYQDDLVTAFHDNNPQAPTHVLIVPNEHLDSIRDVREEHDPLLGRMCSVANQIAGQEQIAESGYRIVINRGAQAGQSVYHLHLHLLGGRRMKWPPG